MKCSSCRIAMVIPGKKTCKKCLDESKKRSVERYRKIKLERICKSCPNKVLEVSGIYCSACRLKKKDVVNIRKTKGLCITCGKNEKVNGLKCDKCYKSYWQNKNQRRQQRASQGLCEYCDGKKINNRLCLKHFLIFNTRNHLGTSKRHEELYDVFLSQNGICPYTKIKLTLGENASIDHIVPKSRGRKLNDTSNLQWVHSNVNTMKSDMLEHEFLDLVRLIAKNNPS